MSQGQVAFAARENAGDDLSGTVSIGDGETFDVGEALQEGDGTIVVVEDTPLARALVDFPTLKRTTVPDGATAVNADEALEEATVEVKASPAAQSKAEELGVNLDEVDGTGANGAIKVEDVEKAAEGADSSESKED